MKPCRSRECVALFLRVIAFFFLIDMTCSMSADEKVKAKEQVVELFYHAYNAYMDHAYPADELMPLSCKGRYRGSEPSRGDVDDTLGNFTLTLIDSIDTLAVLGDVQGFEEAVRNIIKDARFDCDVIVSVFETNIRILGGLLGGHVMASYFKKRGLGLGWYNDELLSRAKEVGDRLLPAFNTSTGIPYPRINLKHGIVSQISSSYRDTCTACAGSMILEFAALSRLTGISHYEDKARKAMDYLWHQRHRSSDLMGLIINVHSGDWIRRESGVGAGIDSYYEYVLKAYILLGDDNYLDRFNKHYDAVMRYVSQGPLLMDVHMHKPNAISRNFMDALLAFWPGLQVLKGDLVPAIETHEMLYQVLQRHNFIPEAFTTDFRVHWGHHPLRPEFIESTYFLYKATGDNYYLEVGKKVLDNLEEHARVDCGLAAIKNVKTGDHEDQMDSYVLAEMFKYLYLLFAEKEEMLVDIDDFIFTTEAHLLPLSLSMGNLTAPVPKIRRDAYRFKVELSPPMSDNYVTSMKRGNKREEEEEEDEEEEEGEEVEREDAGKTVEGGDHMCPAVHTTHAAGHSYPHIVRSGVQNIVNRVSPQRRNRPPRMRASEFIAGNKEQLEQLHAMGIRIATMTDGRVQLLHTASEAQSPEDAEDGMQFMQEMIELSKQQQQEAHHDPMFIHISIPGVTEPKIIRGGPAQFGYDLKEKASVSGMLAIARPFRVCKEIENIQELTGHIVILERGDCMFVDKARNLQRIGARGGIVIDHTEGSTSDTQPLFAMSGDGTNDVDIPLVFLYHTQGQQLLQLLADNSFLHVTLSSSSESPSSSSSSSHESSGWATSGSEPQNVEASSGETEDSPPAPLLGEKPDIPSTDNTILNPRRDLLDDPDDSFSDHMDDKFYHHEAQLRDLYYLQTGSRYLHVNLEVRPSATKPKPLSQRESTFSLDALPDGSKMVTVRLTYQSQGYERSKPQLNQMYVDAVHLLQTHTNFNDLPHTTDYLRALARCLEAGYFGLSRVDSDALTLLRGLSRQLQYVHRFPAEAQRPDIDAVQSRSASSDRITSQTQSPDEIKQPYAELDDFVESAARKEWSSSVLEDEESKRGQEGDQYIQFVAPSKGGAGYAAHVDKDGKLNIVSEQRDQQSGRQRNSFSVKMTADDRKNIVVKISDDDSSVSQSQSFSVEESSSTQDTVGAKSQSRVSSDSRGQSISSGDRKSQSEISGSIHSQSHSSRSPDGDSDISDRGELKSRPSESTGDRHVEDTQGDLKGLSGTHSFSDSRGEHKDDGRQSDTVDSDADSTTADRHHPNDEL